MLCPQCDRTNPDDAQFCDGCGAALAPGPSPIPAAATGPTVRLPEAAPLAPSPTPAGVAPVGTPGPARRLRQMNGGLWLIGLGVLFFTGTIWPGVLVLIGISAYLEETARGRTQQAFRALIFSIGLAALFALNWFWPGILILLGLTALLSPEVRPRHA